MPYVEIPKYLRCLRCGHNWIPRGRQKERERKGKIEVRICPYCKSPYWDRKKTKRR